MTDEELHELGLAAAAAGDIALAKKCMAASGDAKLRAAVEALFPDEASRVALAARRPPAPAVHAEDELDATALPRNP